MHPACARTTSAVTRTRLISLRARVEAAWTSFHGGEAADAAALDLDRRIARSWARSRQSLGAFLECAPLESAPAESHRPGDAPLMSAARDTLEELQRDAVESGMVAALSDASGRLVWTGASRLMRARAERVNFTPGARWDEDAIGTNAVAVAVRDARPATVFSAEHYAPAIHDWVCYAAPILHPSTGVVLGSLDLSTVWEKHNPLALRAVQAYASEVARALPGCLAPQLRLELLGRRAVLRVDERIHSLTPRQAEILCALVLHPEGLDLEALHDRVYGDAGVSLVTLKSEISRLRQLMPAEAFGSRPYRFLSPIDCDLIKLLDALREGDASQLLERCTGPLLPGSQAPCVAELHHRIAFSMQRACEEVDDPAPLALLLQRMPDHPEASRRLMELLARPRTAPQRPRCGTIAAHERD
jgi:hypothetical protein